MSDSQKKSISALRAKELSNPGPFQQTLIQRYTTGIIRGMIEQVDAIGDLEHATTKGTYREIFVANVLDRFLVPHLGIASGMVINQRGDESPQIDVIIYDKRLLPPFIREERLGVFPVESVVCTIEVKSRLSLDVIESADIAAKKVFKIATTGSINPSVLRPAPPYSAIIGFFDHGVAELRQQQEGGKWLDRFGEELSFICLPRHFSWFRLNKEWSLRTATSTGEETKRFIALMLDRVRTHAETNYQRLNQLSRGMGKERTMHFDWLGVYLRDQEYVSEMLRIGP